MLYKAQEEADPLGAVPKKEGESQQESVNAGSAKNVVNGESSTASISSNAEQDASPIHQEGALDDGGMSLVMNMFFMNFLLYQLILSKALAFYHSCCILCAFDLLR